jgi:predicted nuclease of restriction endonuclease-like (RecB) superfamily
MNLENQFAEIHELIRNAKERAFHAVNNEMINLYWQIGEYVSKKVSSEQWGNHIVKNLSEYIQKNEPDTKGFSPQNIWRMKQFYETYNNNIKLSPLVRELSWTNNLLILSKTNTEIEKEFYIKLSIQERFKKKELERQLDSGLFDRVMTGREILSPKLREMYPSAEQVFRDTYMLDFLKLPKPFNEKDFKNSILANLKLFILEFGKNFIFIADEYRVQVGNSDFFIDLLFYHCELQCLVAIELKTTDFKPEYLGKMEFYLEALDRDVKKEHEKPSVGIILCKYKDFKIVEYSLSRSL